MNIGCAEGTFTNFSAAGEHVDSELFSILEYTDKVILDTGIGWESEDVLNPSVVYYGGMFFNYYSGWDGNVWRTGLAVSSDGKVWEKTGEYLLDIREDYWDNTYIAANGSALSYADEIYYYYQGTDARSGHTQIGLAISSDGYSFEKRSDDPVLIIGESEAWDSHAVADPYVINYDGKLYMYYLGMDCHSVQRLGVAMSDDGINWVKYKNNPIMDLGIHGAFDENGLGEPSVIYKAPYFYMLYTGRNAYEQRNIGFAISKDGINWKKMNIQGIINLNENDWDNQVVCDTTLLENYDGTISVWYGGGNVALPDQGLNGKIGMFIISLLSASNMTHFDAVAWKNEGLDIRDFIDGIYQIEKDEEREFVWASESISVILKNEKEADHLLIKGSVGMNLFDTDDQDTLTLEFILNNKVVGRQIIREDSEFTHVIDKSNFTEEYINLRIQASDYVNPLNSGVDMDEKKPVWILNSIVQE